MFFSTKEIPSPQSLFSAYASMAASLMLFRSLANDFIPNPIRSYLIAGLRYLFKSRSPLLTLIIEESNGISPNQVYEAAEMYLCTKINPNTERLRISKTPKEKNLTVRLEKGEKIVDVFDGIELHWSFVCVEQDKNNNPNVQFPTLARSEKRFFQLSFNKKHQEKVLGFYIPFILEKAIEIKNEERVLKMYTMNRSDCFSGKWESVNLEHPAKFETLAMESEVKSAVIEDLNRFLKRKEFYKRVGKAWKRGYLLYGPPGTGKSSLIAAMANYLKFDIYDLQLGNVMHDSDLRKLLLKTGNRSILVIEDIDCSVELPDRRIGDRPKHPGEVQLTLSGLLNFIDGLWSSCGDERIIVFTTNHKDHLDPALLRPGRMDMHIHMSYCTFHGFKLLANNYLQIHDSHYLFSEIENLLGETEVTPAQVAEELMKSEDAEVSLEGLIKLLKRKKMEDVNGDGEGEGEGEFRELKRLKILNKSKKFAAKITRRKCIRGRRI